MQLFMTKVQAELAVFQVSQCSTLLQLGKPLIAVIYIFLLFLSFTFSCSLIFFWLKFIFLLLNFFTFYSLCFFQFLTVWTLSGFVNLSRCSINEFSTSAWLYCFCSSNLRHIVVTLTVVLTLSIDCLTFCKIWKSGKVKN